MSRIWHETSRHEIENRESNLVNTNVQYCSVVRTRYVSVTQVMNKRNGKVLITFTDWDP